MRRWMAAVLASACLLVLSSGAGAQDYKRIGGKAFLDYDVPMFSLRSNWYSATAKWGGSLVYSVNARLTMEFEYSRIRYRHGKIETRAFQWNVDNQEYKSPHATANMNVDSGVINFLFRLGNPALFTAQTNSAYLVLGTGFHDYRNYVSGLVYPGQTVEPLDLSQVLPLQKDRRAALGVSFGLGVERFLSRNFSLDFRVQHNFLIGYLSPRESWGVKEVSPIQMLDMGVAFKFYETGK